MAFSDEAVWQAERSLWLEGNSTYQALVEPDAVVAVPGVGLMTGAEAIEGTSEEQLAERRHVGPATCPQRR